jgi:hypothetical protein
MAFTKSTPREVAATMVDRDSGQALTAGVSVKVWNSPTGAAVAGAGTLRHLANGVWAYLCTASEWNAEAVHVIFTHATGITQVREIFPDSETLGSKTNFDWSAAERNQIREALGVDGGKIAAAGGALQNIKSTTDQLQIVSGRVLVDQKALDGSTDAVRLSRELSAAIVFEGVITSHVVATNVRFSVNILKPTNFFQRSFVTFKSGVNSGQSRLIGEYTNNATHAVIDITNFDITLNAAPGVGDQIIIDGRG